MRISLYVNTRRTLKQEIVNTFCNQVESILLANDNISKVCAIFRKHMVQTKKCNAVRITKYASNKYMIILNYDGISFRFIYNILTDDIDSVIE